MKKFLLFLMAGLLLFSTDILGQVTNEETGAAIPAVTHEPFVDELLECYVSEPSIPTSNLFTEQDSTGKMIKIPFDKLPADTRASMYYFGRGVERNLDKAIECLESMLAENNSVTNQNKRWSLQYIKWLKESQYLDTETKMCTSFNQNLGETNDYFERVIQNDAPIAIKRERALLWITVFFRPEEYTIESSDNSSKLIIKFRCNDNFYIKSTYYTTWYSFSGQLMLDFKDTRYRVRLMYPNYYDRTIASYGDVLPEFQYGVIQLMNESRSKISDCLRYENGFEWEHPYIKKPKTSKRIKETFYRGDVQSVYEKANAFLTIMEKYNSIFSSLEEELQKAVDARNVKADDF